MLMSTIPDRGRADKEWTSHDTQTPLFSPKPIVLGMPTGEGASSKSEGSRGIPVSININSRIPNYRT